MSLVKLFVVTTCLLATTVSFADNSRSTASSPRSPVFKKAGDPSLYFGLGRNPVDCPYKNQADKNEATAGTIFGKSQPTVFGTPGLGNR
jgi:hypothetical protein